MEMSEKVNNRLTRPGNCPDPNGELTGKEVERWPP